MKIDEQIVKIDKMKNLFKKEADGRDDKYEARPKKWRESEAGEEYLFKVGALRACADSLSEATVFLEDV